MPEEPFKNREILEMVTDVRGSLQRIEVQTSVTNGRVSKLENWRWFITGGMTIITVVVIPILAWALWVLINIPSQIHAGVNEALSAYDIQIK